MSMNKKRRGLWYKHREYVHDEVLRMVKKANKGLEPERQVPFATALEVANRSLKKNRNPYSAARAFAALRAVSSFITMATTGTEAIGSFEHFDLLPIGHPLSTRSNSMTASALQHAQARWLAADPSVDASVRPLVAAAHAAPHGSDERRYMFARLSALTNDDAPLWLRLDDPMTMFGPLSFIGGNSSAARRARAQLQRRDRRGRFAEMGGGWSLNVLGLDGLFSTVSGRVVGAVGDDAVEVEIIGNSELPDGIYTMPSNKGEAVKAILSLDVVKDLPKRKAVAGDDVFMSVGELQATRKDVPTGWTAAGRTKDGKKLTRYYNSEDGYEVGVTKNEDGTYEYSVRRLENVGESKFEKSYGSWGDVLKAVVADQDEYERDLEKAAEGLPQPAPKPAAPAALPPVAERNFRKGDTPVEFLKKGDLIPRYYPNQLGEKQLKKNRAEDPNFEMQPADEIIGITQSSKKGKLGLRVRDLKTGEERSFEVNAKAVIPDTRIYEPGAPKAEKVPTPSAPEDEETESVLTPFDARDLLERSMRESGGILARMSDDELDRLSNDDGEKLERYNVAIEEAQDLLDGVDPVGSSDNFEIFEQAFDKLGEAVDALEEVDNPDLENAGIELKQGLQSYLDKKDLVDFSGTRATETPSTPPPTSPVPSPAKPYTQAQIEQGESELIDILDSMIGDLEANRNPSQAYETRDWVGYEEAIFPTFVDEQIAEARASGDTELEDFNAPMNAAVDKHRKRLEKIEEMSRKAVERGDIKSAEGLAEELKRLRDDIAAEGPEDEEENATRDLERSSFLESVSERARLALDGNEFDEILESALDSNALTPEEKINIDDAVALFDREIDEANGLVDDDDRDEALNDAGNAFYDRVSEIIEGKRTPATPMTPPPSRPPTGVERAESGDSVKSMMKDLLELENGEAPNFYKAIYTNLIEEDGQIIDGATLEMPDGSKVVYDRDAREWVYSDADGVELNRTDALDPKASEKIFKGFEDRVPKKPAKPAVDSGLPEFLETEFDEMFEAPYGSHKPNIFEMYSPVGRQDQESEDYTDDPSILSNKFSTEELGRALREAVLPSAVGEASGQGTLEFEAGDELVPAEALYEALQMSGLDADMLLAAFYDSMLPEDPGAPTNVDRVQERRSEVPAAPSEPEIVPLTDRGKAVEEAIKLNEALGIPARAQRGVELMNEYNEGNDKLLGIAEKLNSLQDFDDAYDDEGLTDLLKDYIPFANSGDPDEVEAFAGLWGLLMSLDGGASNDQPGPEELADGGFRARVRRAIEESLREGDNDDIDIEDLVDDIYNDIVETYGGFPEFVAGREAISNGEGDLNDRTTAAAFYRLTKAAARPTTVEVQRSIGVDPSDPLFTRYTTPGSVFSIDPRSFTTNNLADAKGIEGLQFAPGSNFAHVIFRVAPGDADTFSAKTISWFPGEEEHLGWGNYEVVGVRTLDNPLRPNQPKVEVMIRKTDNEVGVPSEQSIFEDTKTDVSNWRKTGSQAGSNPGGFYEDDDGNEYYVKIPKSQKHAENEVLASKFYERLGVPAAEVRLGEDNGETRIVSPLIPGAVGDLSEHLDDEEYLRKLRDGFVADAWLANWDVAGLVFDNVMSDADGNPVRVDPGGSLIYRARGSEKGAAFGDKVGEIDTLRDPDLNPQNAQIFGGITDEELMDQASRLRRLSPEEIDAIVDSVVTDPEMASKLKMTLKARREDILSRFPGDDDDDIFTERTPLTDALSREVSSLEPGDILGEDSFVIESVFTDDRTPDGKISVQGYYPGHQSQRKEYDPTDAVEASRGGAIPPKGDNEPLHRPEPPTNPDNPAEMAAYRDELAQYEMAKAVASAWNCGGAGLTAAVGGNGPCSVPSVDQLIDKVNSDTVGPIEVPDQDGVDVTQANTTAKAMKAYTENIDEAFESIDLLEKDEDVKPSVKKKLATVKSKLQEIRDNVGNFGGEDQKISNEEAISQLNELISGLDRTNDDIDFIASAIERLRDVVDGSAFLEKADPNLPPPGMMHPKKGFPLGYAKDGVTKVVPGMLVRDKDGFAGVVDRYEKANWVGVYVINALDGQLYMKATHQLVPINPGDDDSAYIEKPGGYSGHPKMKTLVPQGSVDTKFDGWNEKAKKKNEDAFGPRQESAEVPKVEAPSGAPEAPAAPAAPEIAETPEPLPSDVGDDASALQVLSAGAASNMLQEGVSSALALIEDIDTDKLDDQEQGQLSDVYSYLSNASMILSNIIPDGSDLNYEMFQEALQEMTYAQDTLSDLESNNPMFGEASRELMIRTEDYLKYEDLGKIDWNGSSLEQPDEDEEEIDAEIEADAVSEEVDIDVPEYISSGEGEEALRAIISIVQENLEKVDTSNLAETDKTSLDDAKSKLESVVEKFDKGQKGSYETYMLALNDARVARDILSQTSGDKAFPTAVEDIDSLIRYAETKVDIVSDEEVTMKDLAEFITPAVMRDQLKFALQDALAVVDEFDESYPDYFKNEKKIDKTLKHIKAALASLASVDTAGSAENKKLFKSARSEMEKASNLLDQLEEFSYDAAEVKGNIDVALEEFDQADSEDRIDYKGTIMKAAKQAFGEEVAVDQIITSGKMRDDLVAEITDVTTTIDKLDLEDMYLEDFAEDIVAAYKILKSTLADLSSIDPDGAEKNSGLFAAVTSDMERAKDLLEEANGNFEVKKAIDKIDLALMAYEDVTNGGLLDFNGDKLAKAKKEADIVDEEQEVTPEVPLSNAPLTDSDRVKYEELFLSETTKLAAVTSLLNLSDSSKLGQDDLTRKYSAKQSIEDARNILRKMPSAYDRESKDKLLDDTERVLLDARAQLGSSGDYYLLQAASEISLYLDYVHGRRELIGIDYATPVTKNEEFAAAEARESLIGILDEAIKGVVLSKSNEGYAELYEDLLDARQAAGKLKNRDGFDAEAYKSIREVIGSRMSGISDLLGEDEENEKRLEKIRKNIERFDKIPAYIRGSKQPLVPSTQEPLLEQAPNKYEDFKKMPAGLRGSISMVMDELKTMQAMFELEYSSDMLQVKQGFMNPKDLTNKLIADLREGKVRFSEIATRVEEIRERHEEIARTGQNASITQTSISSSTSYGSVAGVLSSLRDARDNVYEQISLHPDIANDRYKLDIGEVPTDPYADEPYFSNEKVKNYSGIKELANVFGYREKNPDKTVDTFEAMRQMKTTDWVSTFAKHLYARIQIDAGRMEDDENVASVEEIIQTANDIKRMLDHAGFGSTMYGPIREGLLMFFGAQKLSPTLRSTVNDIIEKKLDAALGVERPKDVERLPWDRSGLRGIPSLEDATDMSRKRRGQIISTAVDGADIEDLTVEVTTALPSTTSKKLQTRYTFKLTSWAARKFDEKFDLGDKPGFTTTRDIVLSVLKGEGDAPRTFGKKTLSADSVGSGRTMTYEFDDKIDGVPVKIRLIRADREGNTAGKAFNSQVTILVPDGTDPQIVQKAMEKVGVVEARPAMPIDTRALIENRMISVFMGQTDANDNVNSPDRRAQYLSTIKKRFGLTPDDVKLVPASAGRIEMRIPPEVAAKIKQETGVLNFYHSLYTMNDKRVSSILSWTEQKKKAAEIIADMFTSDVGTEGTLLATTKRFLRGMKSVTGMSQSEDIRTGGADYIFTTPSDSDFYIQNGGQLKLVYDSEKMFERMDFYSNEWDAYGARESSSDVIGMTRDGSHETIFKGGIGPEALRHLIVPDVMFKEFMIEAFRKRGINSINGIPIEVFVTYGTAKEAKDLALVQQAKIDAGETDNDGNPVADDF